MLNDFNCSCPVYIACGYTDLRRGIDGLANLVKSQFQMDPFQRALFLFCGRRRDRLKALYWEGDGFLLTACGIVYWICRRSFSVGQKKGPWVLLFLVLFVVLCAGIFLRQPIAALPVPAAVCVVAALFVVYKLMDLRLD